MNTPRRVVTRRAALGAAALVALSVAPALAQDWVQAHLAYLDESFASIVDVLATVLFADLGTGVPLIVAILVAGGIYYTFYFRWLSVRAFRHSIDVIRGRYDDPDDPGELTHFQALSSALSATIGLGNIAGVAIAVSVGGPGAVFWMVVTAVFGMSSKLASCTLAVMYRRTTTDGHVYGGPMYYMVEGLGQKGMGEFGRTLAVAYAFLCIGGSLGGGNMFQSNQTLEILGTVSPWFRRYNWLIGLALAALVGLVIIGGIRRIGHVTARIVPFMCVLYVVSALFVILWHASQVPAMIVQIVSMAFTGPAVFGGFLGVLVTGVRRAAFSNEAGLGSAAFAHATARTDEPAREGIVAMIGPFIDTIVICSMTALVCLITGTYLEPEFQNGQFSGTSLTAAAFDSVIPGARYVLAVAVVLFAFSTMISWSYYGERSWEFLFGRPSVLLYRLLFLVFVFLGSVTGLTHVVDFSDMMILGMAFPNIVAGVLLSPQVRATLEQYWGRLQRGEMTRYR